MTQIIEGIAIRLERLKPEDVTETYVAWLNDPNVNQFLESRFVTHSLESVRAYVASITNDERNHFFKIIRSDTGMYIGNIKLGPIDRNHRLGDIGLMIGDKDSWGKGFATAAIQAITAYAFNDLMLHKVTAGAYENNIGSIKAFEKCGFIIEATRPSHFYYQERYVGHVLMAHWNETV